MTQAQQQTGSNGDRPRPVSMERELAIEQAHVDLVYSRLEEATRSAQQVASAGRALFQSDRSSFVREEDGTGLYERDVFAFQAAKRLAVLDAEHDGLVFGRLDRTDGEIRYVGPDRGSRRRLRTAGDRLARTGRRAVLPGHAQQPDAGRAAPGAALLRQPGRRDRGRPAGLRVRHRPGRARRGCAAGGAESSSRPHHARHRRHDPGRTGRGHPRPVPGFHDDLGRARHREDGGGAAPGRFPALLEPPPLRIRRRPGGRPEPGVHELHRARPALPGRGRGHPPLHRVGRLRRRETQRGTGGFGAGGRDQGQSADGRRAQAAGPGAMAARCRWS